MLCVTIYSLAYVLCRFVDFMRTQMLDPYNSNSPPLLSFSFQEIVIFRNHTPSISYPLNSVKTCEFFNPMLQMFIIKKEIQGNPHHMGTTCNNRIVKNSCIYIYIIFREESAFADKIHIPLSQVLCMWNLCKNLQQSNSPFVF